MSQAAQNGSTPGSYNETNGYGAGQAGSQQSYTLTTYLNQPQRYEQIATGQATATASSTEAYSQYYPEPFRVDSNSR